MAAWPPDRSTGFVHRTGEHDAARRGPGRGPPPLAPPGQGTRLHRHDAEELIIVHAGRGTYTVGDTTAEAGPGDVVVIPPGVPDRWVNHGQEPLVHTGVFSTDGFAMEVVDD